MARFFVEALMISLVVLIAGVEVAECTGRILAEPVGKLEVSIAEMFITSTISKFGNRIEAAAVNKYGSIFASNFESFESSYGEVACFDGKSVQPCQHVFFKDPLESSDPYSLTDPYYNGLRFLPTKSSDDPDGLKARALGADVNQHRVVLLTRDDTGVVTRSVFCNDSRMTQPNDVAIAPTSGRVYTSGQNYTATTKVGDGDLWICEAPGYNIPNGPAKAIRLGVFGRTNGIEVSPDERTLYLSEAFNVNYTVVSNVVWRFDIDAVTGNVSNKTLFVDFAEFDGSQAFDVDGMRTDMDGNLFISRNGGGRVNKFSPEGGLLHTILTPGITDVTNLDFGGPDGKTLFVVGACDNGNTTGCAVRWEGNPVPGRAFTDLNRHFY